MNVAEGVGLESPFFGTIFNLAGIKWYYQYELNEDLILGSRVLTTLDFVGSNQVGSAQDQSR
jgi:hypothetical protein